MMRDTWQISSKIIYPILGLIILLLTASCSRVYNKNNLPQSDGSLSDGPENQRWDVSTNPKVDQTSKVDQTPTVKTDGATLPANWKLITPGTFIMGSPLGELCRFSNEKQHSVTLTHAFEIMTAEVTIEEYLKVRGYNPASFSDCTNQCPAGSLSWHEAAAYCNELSSQRGYAACYTCSGAGDKVTCAQAANYQAQLIYTCPGYRLPTEAEWEYAYRAGTTTSFYNNTNIANCNSDKNADAIGWNVANNNNGNPSIVGQKPANNWGLYDMAGNMLEWVNDFWDGTDYESAPVTDPWGQSTGNTHSIRGGSYPSLPREMRAAFRLNVLSGDKYADLGVRCVRTH